jgi:hypothetical protein
MSTATDLIQNSQQITFELVTVMEFSILHKTSRKQPNMTAEGYITGGSDIQQQSYRPSPFAYDTKVWLCQ